MVGDGELLTTGEAAKVIGVSKSTVIKLIKTGKLPASTLPGSTHQRVSREAAEAMRNQWRPQPR